MPDKFTSQAQNLLGQLALATPNFAPWPKTTPWVEPFTTELLRKISWSIASTYSNYTFPALPRAQIEALTGEAVSHIVLELFRLSHGLPRA